MTLWLTLAMDKFKHKYPWLITTAFNNLTQKLLWHPCSCLMEELFSVRPQLRNYSTHSHNAADHNSWPEQFKTEEVESHTEMITILR